MFVDGEQSNKCYFKDYKSLPNLDYSGIFIFEHMARSLSTVQNFKVESKNTNFNFAIYKVV